MVSLGGLGGGSPYFTGTANGVSADGSVVVDQGMSPSGYEAFIWDATNGIRELDQALIDLGLDPANLAGWTLSDAKAISDDGLTIVGKGTNPSGYRKAWIAIIPEPSTASLFALGLMGIAAGRRRTAAARR
jgi:uncharacterized membrane protein